MIYTIIPYVSVGDFSFGRTRAQIGKAEGKPFTATVDNIQGIVTEERSGCSLVYEEKKLAYVTLSRHVTPIVNGVEIYADGSIEKLKALDSDHSIGSQYIVFRGLGLCVGGFSRKKIPEGRIVNAFSIEKKVFFEFFTED